MVHATVFGQSTLNILFHPSAEKLVLTHINSQDWKLYHNIQMIGEWGLMVICVIRLLREVGKRRRGKGEKGKGKGEGERGKGLVFSLSQLKMYRFYYHSHYQPFYFQV